MAKPTLAVLPDAEAQEAPADTTPDETPAEAPAPTQEVVSDQEMLARVRAEMEGRLRAQPKRVTMDQLFGQLGGLVAGAMDPRKFRNGEPYFTEQGAIRILELTLFWAANTASSGQPQNILPDQELLPVPPPDETIGSDADQETN